MSAPLVPFAGPTRRGYLVRRWKRFLAEVELEPDHRLVAVHVPNSGSMLGLAEPGREVVVSWSPNPGRKLPWTLELVAVEGGWAGVNTMLPNALVAAALGAELIPELAGYLSRRQEVSPEPGTRFDFCLEHPDRPRCWVEVKNVTLARAGEALFPDSITSRGLKHLRVLEKFLARGDRAVVFFLVQRPDCERFRPAGEIDPRYAAGLKAALAAGVEALCWRSRPEPEGISLDRRLELCPGQWPV